MSFTDVHHHLLWGLDDDGPKTRQEMYGMVRRAAADGVATLVATPHVAPGLRFFDGQLFLQRLEDARVYAAQQGLNLILLPGSEILFTPYACEMLRKGQAPTLAGTDHALVEFSPRIACQELQRSLRQVAQAGFVPVLAHCERYACLVRHPALALELKAQFPVCFQVNASTFLRRQGFWLRRFLKRMMETGLVDFIASDAHNLSSRKVNLSDAFKEVSKRYGEETASRLLGSNGKAMVKQL